MPMAYLLARVRGRVTWASGRSTTWKIQM